MTRSRRIHAGRVVATTSGVIVPLSSILVTDDTGELDRMMRRAREFKSLILDVRAMVVPSSASNLKCLLVSSNCRNGELSSATVLPAPSWNRS